MPTLQSCQRPLVMVGRVKPKRWFARGHIPLQNLQLSQSNKQFRCSNLFQTVSTEIAYVLRQGYEHLLTDFMLLLQWCHIVSVSSIKRLPSNKNEVDTDRFCTINHLLSNNRNRDREKRRTVRETVLYIV
jgi:hypothetical protein